MPDELTPDVIDQTSDVTPADVLDQDALLNELAGLPPLDYDQRRTSTAKMLGVRVGALDAEVAARRQRQAETAGAQDNGAEQAAMPEPWTDTVDGAQLLAELSAYYARYVVLPEGAADALALCTEHTYAVDAAQITPRLAVVSPQPRCGKTTLIALLGAATARPLSAANITASALFRAIEAWRPTMLIDEADTFLKDNEDLRGVLNAGHYRPTAYVIRSVPVDDSWEPRAFRVWGPVAIALIGSLPSTLADRSITIKLRRKTKHEQVERLRLDRLGDTAEPLRRRCLRWAQDNLARLGECDPAMPDLLHDRAADNWRPLCAIAEVAGGDWPQRGRTRHQSPDATGAG
jgi:putative DNA primase/helicase